MIMTLLERRGTFLGPRGKIASNLTNLTLSKQVQLPRLTDAVGLSLGLFLPPAIAYFPQRAATDPSKLEPPFRSRQGKVYFNKGL